VEKAINHTQIVKLFLLAVATAVVGVSSILSTIPVQTVNAQTLGEFILLTPGCEIKDDKVECPGGIEGKLDNGEVEKIELPGCEIKFEEGSQCEVD
jgi:hypothetical protein